MSYHITKTLKIPFDEAVARVTEELAKEGFGILTEIDVKATLKKKLDVDFVPYKILGACNPNYAYEALQVEDKLGAMLPCNVLVHQKGDEVDVSAIDPVASMAAIDNPKLKEFAAQVREKLRGVIEAL